ncbi:hypothetical protein CC86DRAFT_387927 [Ophiobolus disseminans]|uniref:Uncharacterized protein n=1 Tax=Ophiobolus disseminans TaxID=1469910 RepID=A0A6A6ZH24_9PLEO|nr:hypothetical protein CC86DRAFT_387927 [Ophiobolus disseminans]
MGSNNLATTSTKQVPSFLNLEIFHGRWLQVSFKYQSNSQYIILSRSKYLTKASEDDYQPPEGHKRARSSMPPPPDRDIPPSSMNRICGHHTSAFTNKRISSTSLVRHLVLPNVRHRQKSSSSTRPRQPRQSGPCAGPHARNSSSKTRNQTVRSATSKKTIQFEDGD